MKKLIVITTCCLLASCASKKTSSNPIAAKTSKYSLQHDKHPERHHVPDLTKIKDPVPKIEPKSRSGNPASYVVLGKRYHVLKNNYGYKEIGIASWYGMKFHGFRTSSGEPYDMYAMTAAHKTLLIPCYARVTNLDNNKSIIVKVTDRGPFPPNRLIDLSYAAAAKLDVLRKGTARVRVEVINPKSYKPKHIKKEKEIYDASQYLQVAAFRQKDNAEKLVEKIRTLSTHPVFIKQDHNSNIYKVHVGPLDNINIEKLTSTLLNLDLIPQLVSLK